MADIRPQADPALPPVVKPVIRVTLALPEAVYDQYAERATKFGKTVEQELTERLLRLKDHTSITPICFNDDDRAKLTHIMGRSITKPGELLGRLGNLVTLTVGEIKVNIPERVQVRLKSRIFRGETLAGKVAKIVVEALEQECGLRPR